MAVLSLVAAVFRRHRMLRRQRWRTQLARYDTERAGETTALPSPYKLYARAGAICGRMCL
jgi:hypothetical protein